MVEWKPRHIDLGREASIMHTILSAQLKILNITDAIKQSIQPLPVILEGITRASEEDEGDPLTSTFEALRAMQTTISQFNPNSGENSESSSEYTTPAQSQTTSPSHEQSPPPPGAAMQAAHATVGSAAKLLTMQNSGGSEHQHGGSGGSSSPTTSPTHSERVSSLATHSHHATSVGKQPHSGLSTRTRSSHSSVQDSSISLDIPGSSSSKTPRRKSAPDVQRHKVRPSSQQLQGSVAVVESSKHGKHSHSRSIDYAVE